MAVDSKNEFVKCLKASQIIKPEKLVKLLEKYPTDDVKKFAGRLIQDGALSHWQAKVLYSGRHKLNLGNYILLDRIRRDELGDRFRATHKSLDRPVEIQLLPKTVSENVHLQNSFIGNVGLISELDHPQITHIHDVDREGTQFFLVDEAHDGLPLDQIDITPEGLILCTHQILQALAFAHSHSVIHGEVNVGNIVCVNNSHFKICGMGLSLVRRKLAGLTAATARDDLVALATILDERFAQFSPEEQQEYAWLGKNLARLKTDPISVYPRVVVATEQIIETWENAQPPVTIPEHTNADRHAEPLQDLADSGQENFGFGSELIHSVPDIDVDNTLATADEQANAAEPTEHGEEDQLRPATTSTVLLHPLVFGAIGLAVIGIGTLGILFGIGAFSNPGEVAKKNTEANSESDRSTTPDDPTDVFDRERPKLPEKLSPEDIAKALAAVQGGTADVMQQTTPVSDTQVTTRKPDVAPQTDPPQDDTSTEPSTTETVPTPPIDTTTDPPPTPAVETPIPFAFVKSSIDLPASDSKDGFPIAELAEHDKVDSLEVISLPTAFSNGKGSFGVTQVDDKSWDILQLNKPGGTGAPVARISVEASGLIFNWYENVTKRSRANAIRNCVLKLTGGSTSKEIMLREAVTLDLKLTEESYTRKIKTDVDWLPTPEAVKVEVAKPTAPWPASLFTSVDTPFPETFTFDEFNTPLPIFFSPDPNTQHLSIVLQPVINKSLAFNLGVFAQGKETGSVQYKSFESAEETVKLLQRAKESKIVEKNRADLFAQNARYGQITKAKDAAAAIGKELKLIKDNLEISGDIRDMLQRLHEAPIAVTVYYELDGRRVIIAKTSNE